MTTATETETFPILSGMRVVVTRPRDQAVALAEMLEDAGAEVKFFPTIEIHDPLSWAELDMAIRKLAEGLYSWVVFTSTNGVEKFFERIAAAELDARALGRSRVAAVGSITAEALLDKGIRADFVPEKFTGEALSEALGEGMGRGTGRVLVPRAELAPRDMLDVLESAGFYPEPVVAYRTMAVSLDTDEAKAVAAGSFEVLTLTSGSTARSFVDLVGPPSGLKLGAADPPDKVVACIGPKTAATADELGFRLDVVADRHTARGLVDALIEYFEPAGDEEAEADPEA